MMAQRCLTRRLSAAGNRPAAACRSLPRRLRGFSVALILAGIALLAALGAAIAASTQLGYSFSQHNTDMSNALILVNQASNIREGIKLMVARGTPLESISLDANAGTSASSGYSINTTGLYNPTLGGTEPQIPPVNALYPIFSGSSSTFYTWHLITDGAGNPMVKLNGIGTSSPDLVVALVGVTSDICRQINKIVWNNSLYNAPPQTPASGTGYSTENDWGNRPSTTLVDLSAVSGMDKMEQCIELSDAYYVYYAVIRAY